MSKQTKEYEQTKEMKNGPLVPSDVVVQDGMRSVRCIVHVVDIHVEVAQLRAGRDGVRIEVAQLQRRSARDRPLIFFLWI